MIYSENPKFLSCSPQKKNDFIKSNLKLIFYINIHEKMINIQKDNIDPNYRYKMPAVQIKIEGRGKKTVVSNLTEISRSLNRREEEILKFISYEAGTQIKVKNDKMIINKAMIPNDLQIIIYDYIERFVLCPDCDNPETYYKFKLKKDKVYRKCRACGGKNRIKNEKLNKYLLKREKDRPPTPPQPNLETNHHIRTVFKK